MEINQIVKSERDLPSLRIKKGDKLKILKINGNPNLMELEVLHLRTKQVYGFDKSEVYDEKV